MNDDRRTRLMKLRDDLEVAMESAGTGVLAQLAAQYRATLADLAALDEPADEVTLADELAARRTGRGAGTNAPAPARRITKPAS